MQRISIALSALISREQQAIVLSVRLKSPKLNDRLRNSVGSEFQTVGPVTEKARRPNVMLYNQPTTVLVRETAIIFVLVSAPSSSCWFNYGGYQTQPYMNSLKNPFHVNNTAAYINADIAAVSAAAYRCMQMLCSFSLPLYCVYTGRPTYYRIIVLTIVSACCAVSHLCHLTNKHLRAVITTQTRLAKLGLDEGAAASQNCYLLPPLKKK